MLALGLEETLSDFAVLSLLALIQGLTEFLPVSSSGHLVLTQSALKLDEPALVIDVALHVGTLLAVLVVYRRDIAGIARDLFAGKPRDVLLLAVGTLPAVAVALVFGSRLDALFGSPRIAAAGLLGTAVILLAGEFARRRGGGGEERPVTWVHALVIGGAQALAILPGISRSGTTIACALMLGLAPRQAARFSFLLAIPAILGAAVLKFPEMRESGLGEDGAALLWAMLFAGFIGWGALRILLAFLGRGAFVWFAVYCVVLGGGFLVFA